MRRVIALCLVMLLSLGFIGCEKDTIVVTKPATTTPNTDPVTQPATVPSTDPATEPVTEQPTEPTEPPTEPEPTLDNTSLYGIDVTDMTADEAKAAIRETLSGYKVTLTVNGQSFQFTGKELSMSVSEEAFDAWFQKTVQGEQTATTGIVTYNVDNAMNSVKNAFEKDAKNATVSYNKSTKKFQSNPHQDGISADVGPAKISLISAVETLSPSVGARITLTDVPADIQQNDSAVSNAIANANSYLSLNISYTYQADGIPTTTEAISVDDLASFISFSKSLSVEISSSGVKDYISRMSYRNGGIERRGFVTSRGNTISQTVDYYKASLNQSAMYNDLVSCLTNKTSGSRTAPFLPAGISNMPYGGSYVEIDLDNQCLWVYRDGKLVIESPLVSGKVSNRNWTPAGVFSIYGKETCTYLVGPTWRSYVDYWMPFNGGIGLHDANWRTEFGGQIYMYDGSHGCINLPPKNAGIIYNNISIGTKVIVYGGAHSVGTLTQQLTGPTEYKLDMNSEPVELKVWATYTGTTITYNSSDDSVVTVSDKGVVTVVGPGTATITVVSQKMDVVSAAKMEITITVEGEEPEPTDPEPTDPEPTDPEPTDPEPTDPEPTDPEPTDPEPTDPEPTDPEPTDPETTDPEPTETTEPNSPVSSEPPKEDQGIV